MHKKLIIIIVLVIIAVTGWVVVVKVLSTKQPNQAMSNDLIKISKNNFSLSYPKEFTVQEVASTEENYINYYISNQKFQGDGRSSITVSIPLKNTFNTFTLADQIDPKADPTKINKTTLQGHSGESITYRLDTQRPGDIPIHAEISWIILDSQYPTSPLMLHYIKNDNDPSLDKAWEAIKKSIRY